jgi:hypothetical protein
VTKRYERVTEAAFGAVAIGLDQDFKGHCLIYVCDFMFLSARRREWVDSVRGREEIRKKK